MALAGGFSSITAEALIVWHKSNFLIPGCEGWHVSPGTAYIATVYIDRGFQQGSRNHSFFQSWLLQLNGFGLPVRFYDFISWGEARRGHSVRVQTGTGHPTRKQVGCTCTGTRHAQVSDMHIPTPTLCLAHLFFIFYS